MKRADRRRWAAARSLAGLGELVCAWLAGEITQTPGHLGPPRPETIPLIPVLTAVNRAGFVTDNSQAAGRDGARVWEAWVAGFASDATRARLRDAIGTGPLILEARLIRAERWGPLRDAAGFWMDRCPLARGELEAAWYVIITDPEPGRNDRLWPALERFAATTGGAQ